MTTTLVAICPTTGRHLREATSEEAAAYWAGQAHPHHRPGSFLWAHPVRLGDVTIDYYNGPGLGHWPQPAYS